MEDSNWLNLFTETLSVEFSCWLRGATNHIAEKTCYGYNVHDITKELYPDLYDEEREKANYVMYDRDWQGNRCNLRIHPLFKMWKSGLNPKESAQFFLDEFNSSMD